MSYRIIQKRFIFLTISGLLVAASLVSLFVWRLNPGIDFSGGSLLEVQFTNYQPNLAEMQSSLAAADLHNIVIQPADNSVIIRFKEDSKEAHEAALSSLESLVAGQEGATMKELQFDAVGPTIGQELKSKSFNAAFLVLLMIIIYISWAFRGVSKPVASWKYALAAIAALFHDVIITLGVFSVLGHFYGTEINTPFIAAILTVLGYSVNDTIIVFDRIRENLPKSQENFENTVNRSVNQTISRSLNTSLAAMLVLLAILARKSVV